MQKPLLVVIYNHKYPKNIAIIEKIYQQRFSHIHHLMPFYQGNKENVSAVYDNSYYFQGYIAQGLKDYYQKNISHYLFIADDLLLNPAIDEDNYQDFFKLSGDDCYLHKIKNLVDENNREILWFQWNPWAYEFPDLRSKKGLEELKNLPTYDEAVQLFKNHNLQTKHFKKKIKSAYLQVIREYFNKFSQNIKFLNFTQKIGYVLFGLFYRVFQYWQRNRRHNYTIDYPLACGYSDIVIVSSAKIEEFGYYCGVFSAANLFAEIAIPTALVLMDAHIVQHENTGYQVPEERVPSLHKKFQNNLPDLIKDFPKNMLYVHPIKLSVWNK